MPEEEQIIVLRGTPITSFEDAKGNVQKELGSTDTIVEVTGRIPKAGREAQLRFRLVALSLVGSVTDAKGEQWQVEVSLSENREQTYSAAVVKNRGRAREGSGIFNSKLHLIPRFVFTKGEEKKIVDDPGKLALEFTATNAQWTSSPPRGAVRPELSGDFFALKAAHRGEAGQHATKVATLAL